MVIYLILGLIFGLFCIFVSILYNVNLLPLQKQVREIIQTNEYKEQFKQQTPNPAHAFKANKIMSGLIIKTKLKVDQTKEISIYRHENEKQSPPTAIIPTTNLRLLNANFFIDEDLTTMLFKIPNENYVNGIHIFYKDFILTIVMIHKENYSQNMEYIKSKINDDLDNLHNIYYYNSNTICIFDSKNTLVESSGEIFNVVEDENTNDTFGTASKTDKRLLDDGTSTKHEYINDDDEHDGAKFSSTRSETAYSQAPLPFKIYKITNFSHHNRFKITLKTREIFYVNNKHPSQPFISAPLIPDSQPFVKSMSSSSSTSSIHEETEENDYDFSKFVDVPLTKNKKLHENYNYNAGVGEPLPLDESLNPNQTVFQNEKEAGFRHPQLKLQFKKNLIPNTTFNMISNLKNSIF